MGLPLNCWGHIVGFCDMQQQLKLARLNREFLSLYDKNKTVFNRQVPDWKQHYYNFIRLNELAAEAREKARSDFRANVLMRVSLLTFGVGGIIFNVWVDELDIKLLGLCVCSVIHSFGQNRLISVEGRRAEEYKTIKKQMGGLWKKNDEVVKCWRDSLSKDVVETEAQRRCLVDAIEQFEQLDTGAMIDEVGLVPRN